jgi:hypothetical protein
VRGKFYNKSSNLLILVIVIFITNQSAISATHVIGTRGLNSSQINENDNINYIADRYFTINHNGTSLSMGNVTTTANSIGIIRFLNDQSRILDITGNVGASGSAINSINLQDSYSQTLKIGGNSYIANGITSTTSGNNHQVELYSSASDTTIQSNIGTSSNKINQLNIGTTSFNATSNVNLDGDIYANNMIIHNNSAILQTDHTLDIAGNLSIGTSSFQGLIKGSSGSNETINFSGTSQTSGAQLGTANTDEQIDNLTIAVGSTVTFNKDAHVTNFTSTDSDSSTIESNATLHLYSDLLTGNNINQASTGTIDFTGSSTINVTSDIGQSSASTLNVNISNDNIVGVNFSNNLYLNTLTSLSNGKINFNGATTQTIEIANDIGTDANRINAISLSTSEKNLNSNIFAQNLLIYDSINANIANSKTLDISGNIIGTGTIKGNTSADGTVKFSGANDQTIAANTNLGSDASNKLANLEINKTGGTVTINSANSHITNLNVNSANQLNLAENATIDNISFGTTGEVIEIANAKSLNISGDVTSSNQNTIRGADATASGNGGINLTNSGTSTQTINGNLGSNTNYLGSISITANSSGTEADFKGDIYSNNIVNNGGTPDHIDITLSSTSAQTIDTTIGSNVTKLGNININNSSEVSLMQDIYATNISESSSSSNLTFNKSSGEQVIDTVIGASGAAIDNINIAASGGVHLKQNAFIDNITLNQESATIKLADNSTLDISSNVNLGTATNIATIKADSSDSGGTNAALNLSGSSQTINANIGTSTASEQLSAITLGSSLTDINFNGDIHLNNGNISGTDNTNKNLTFGGSKANIIDLGTGEIGASGNNFQKISITNSNNSSGVTLQDQIYANEFEIGNNATVTLNNGFGLNEAATGNNVIKSSSNDNGTVVLREVGTTNFQIGEDNSEIANLKISSASDVNIDKNIYTDDLTFTAAGNLVINEGSNILKITGNITDNSSNKITESKSNKTSTIELLSNLEQDIDVILGDSGTEIGTIRVNKAKFSQNISASSLIANATDSRLTFDGASNQTITVDTGIGSAADRFSITNNNIAGTTFATGDIYANNFTSANSTTITNLNDSNILDATGDIAGGTIQGVADGNGDINLSSTSGTQTISTILGTDGNAINNITTTAGSIVNVNKAIDVNNLTLNSTTNFGNSTDIGIAVVNTAFTTNSNSVINNDYTLDLSAANSITGLNKISGAGRLRLAASGTVLDSGIGIDSNNKISALDITSGSAINFSANNNLHVDNINLNRGVILNLSGSLSTSSNIYGDGTITIDTSSATFSTASTLGTSDDVIAALTQTGTNDFTINGDIYATDFSIATTGDFIFGGTNLNTTNAIDDADKNIQFNGTNSQVINSSLGDNSNSLGTITINKTSGTINFAKDIYANSIAGGSYDIGFNGSSIQTIDANITTANINLSNSSGVTFLQNLSSNILGAGQNMTLDKASDNQTVSGDIGASGSAIGDIILGNNLTAGDIVSFTSDVYASSVVKSTNTNTIAINFNKNTAAANGFQMISTDIGASGDTNTTITLGDNTNNIDFAGNIYAESINASNNINSDRDISFSGSDKIIAATIGANGNKFSTITAKENVNLAGDIYAGSIAATNKNITLSKSSAAQIIDSTIGATGARISNLILDSALHTDGVKFKGDVYVNNMDLGAKTARVDSGATLLINGNVTASTGKITGTVGTGGNVIFDGSSAQTINIELGEEGKNLDIVTNGSNSSLTLNDPLYARRLQSANNLTLNANATLAGFSGVALNLTGGNLTIGSGSILEVQDNITATSGTIIGSGTLKISDTTSGQTLDGSILSSASSLNLEIAKQLNNDLTINNSNVNLNYLTVTSGTLTTTSTNKVAISGNVNVANSDALLKGNLDFNGSSAQTITGNIGAGGDVAGNITISNNSTVTFSGDIYADNISSTTSGSNITFNKDTSSATQNINAKIGKLGSAASINIGSNIDNTNGVTLSQDAHISDFYTGGTANQLTKIANGRTLYMSGNILGSGKIEAATSNDGTITFNGNSIISSNIGTGSSNNIGTINIGANSTATMSKTTDIFANNFNIEAGSTLVIGVGNDDRTQTDIIVAGTATINDNATINFNYDNPDIGQVNTFLTSTNPIVDTLDNISTAVPNKILLDVDLALAGGNTITATTKYNQAAINAVSSGANGSAVISFLESSDNQTASLKSALLNIETQTDLNNAANALTGDQNSASSITSLSMANQTNNIVAGRISNFTANSTGFGSNGSVSLSNFQQNINKIYNGKNNKYNYDYGDDNNIIIFDLDNNFVDNSGIWVQTFGGLYDYESKNNQSGFESNVAGIVTGIDMTSTIFGNMDSLIGISYGYAISDSESSDNVMGGSSTDINSHQISLYNSNYNKSITGFYNSNIINIALNSYESERKVLINNFTETARANFGGIQYGAKTSLGYIHNLSNRVLVTGSAAIGYSKLSQDDYTETGAPTVNMKVENKDLDNLTTELSLSLEGKHQKKDSFKSHYNFSDYSFKPSLGLKWLRNHKTKGQEQDLQFIAAGSKMKVTGTNLIEDIYGLNAGMELYERNSGSIFSIDYKLETGSGYVGHFGSLTYRKLF